MPLLSGLVRSCAPGDAVTRTRKVLEAGFERFTLFAPLWAAEAETILETFPRDLLCAVELFLPFPRGVRQGEPCPFRLGSPHPEERRDAVRWGSETLRFAETNEVRTVVVPPLRLDPALRKAHLRLTAEPSSGERARGERLTDGGLTGERVRRERLGGERDADGREAGERAIPGGAVSGLAAAIESSRLAEARVPLDAFRSVLSRLLEEADTRGVKLALVPGGWADELPSVPEALDLLREFRGGPLGIWPRTSSLAAAADLFPGASESLHAARAAIGGAILSDRDEEGAPLAPGEGDLDWGAQRRILEAAGVWVADVPGSPTVEALRTGLEFLARLAAGPDTPRPKALFP